MTAQDGRVPAGKVATAMYKHGSVSMTRREAARLAERAVPLFKDGRCTWPALQAACRILYRDYDQYRGGSKGFLMKEARNVLRAAETALATSGDLPATSAQLQTHYIEVDKARRAVDRAVREAAHARADAFREQAAGALRGELGRDMGGVGL